MTCGCRKRAERYVARFGYRLKVDPGPQRWQRERGGVLLSVDRRALRARPARLTLLMLMARLLMPGRADLD